MGERRPDENSSYDRETPEGRDPRAGAEPHYAKMGLRESRWAKTDSGWRSVLAIALLAVLCVGVALLFLVLERGWDGMLAMLGY